jgi:hypothetical protein
VKCTEFLKELTNYLDGAIDERTKSDLEDHLAWCHNCYVVCDTTRKTIEIYRDSELYPLPGSAGPLAKRHHDEVHAEQEIGPAKRLSCRIPRYAQTHDSAVPTSSVPTWVGFLTNLLGTLGI